MGGIIESGGLALERVARRVEIAARNVSNMTTPGYKSQQSFNSFLLDDDGSRIQSAVGHSADFSAGSIIASQNPFDLAIAGAGFFVVRSGADLFYTRNGQFARSPDGLLVSPDGMILQSTSGDVSIGVDAVISADGMVLDEGEPRSRVSIMDFADKAVLQPVGNTLFTAPSDAAREVDDPHILQGKLEASNVSTAGEMVAMMAALRGAETGQRLVQLYDDLMAKALDAFGRN